VSATACCKDTTAALVVVVWWWLQTAACLWQPGQQRLPHMTVTRALARPPRPRKAHNSRRPATSLVRAPACTHRKPLVAQTHHAESLDAQARGLHVCRRRVCDTTTTLTARPPGWWRATAAAVSAAMQGRAVCHGWRRQLVGAWPKGASVRTCLHLLPSCSAASDRQRPVARRRCARVRRRRRAGIAAASSPCCSWRAHHLWVRAVGADGQRTRRTSVDCQPCKRL
jgi:hypothetical protein